MRHKHSAFSVFSSFCVSHADLSTSSSAVSAAVRTDLSLERHVIFCGVHAHSASGLSACRIFCPPPEGTELAAATDGSLQNYSSAAALPIVPSRHCWPECEALREVRVGVCALSQHAGMSRSQHSSLQWRKVALRHAEDHFIRMIGSGDPMFCSQRNQNQRLSTVQVKMTIFKCLY